MARARRGSASKVVRCRGLCPIKGRRCRFLLADGRGWCRWHAGQALEATGAPLAHLDDGAISLAQLQVWAAEFDAIGAGETWPARAFVDWLAADQAAAVLSVA